MGVDVAYTAKFLPSTPGAWQSRIVPGPGRLELNLHFFPADSFCLAGFERALEEATLKKESAQIAFALLGLALTAGGPALALNSSSHRPGVGNLYPSYQNQHVQRGPAIDSTPLRLSGYTTWDAGLRRKPDVASSRGEGVSAAVVGVNGLQTYFNFLAPNGQRYFFRANFNRIDPDLYVLPVSVGSFRVLARVTGDPERPVFLEYARPHLAEGLSEPPAQWLTEVDEAEYLANRSGAVDTLQQ